jgi:PAS domain S-box-containing protein
MRIALTSGAKPVLARNSAIKPKPESAASPDPAANARQTALRGREEQYRQLFNLNPCPMWICDENTLAFLDVNEAALRLYGWSRAEFMRMTAKDIRPPKEVPKFLRVINKQRNLRAAVSGEWRHVKRDGTVFEVAVTISSIPVADREARLVLVTDVNESKRIAEALRQAHEQLEQRVLERTAALVKSQQALTRANRALLAITACNDALLRSSGEAEQFHEICRMVVKVGGYRLVWVGLAEHDAKQTVRLVAHAGYAAHYLDNPRITWADSPRGHGPAGTAIRTKQPAILRDLANTSGFAPWRQYARKYGSVTALGLPLMDGNECFGALAIFSSDLDAFDRDEVKLLKQLASDMAFSVTSLRERQERQRLQREILEISDREQRRIGQDLHDGLGQRIAAARLTCAAVAHRLAKERQSAARSAARVERELAQALEDTRQIARGLHPVKPGADSLMAALRELAASVSRMFRVPCRFICRRPVLVPDYAATHLYRIAQEAVSNATHHGRPKHIRIGLDVANGGLYLRVTDDGCGLPPAAKQTKGLGLSIMKYRASVIGATLALASRRGRGTVVTCKLNPAPKESHAR